MTKKKKPNNLNNTKNNNKKNLNNKKNKNYKKNMKKKQKINLKKYILYLLLIISIIFNLLLSINNNKIKNSKKNCIEKVYITDENIVFFGDSITEGYDLEEFFPNRNTINSGVSGNITDDLLNRIEKDVYIYNPSKVFLLIGVNDLNHGRNVKEVKDNIIEIINKIKTKRPYTEIYVESIYPINRDYLDENEYKFDENVTNEKIKQINKKIKAYCEKNNITYIDIYNSLVDENGNLSEEYTKEGLHLNHLGYTKVTNILKKYIKK